MCIQQLGSGLSTAGGCELIVQGSLRKDRAILSGLGSRLYASKAASKLFLLSVACDQGQQHD